MPRVRPESLGRPLSEMTPIQMKAELLGIVRDIPDSDLLALKTLLSFTRSALGIVPDDGRFRQ